MFETIKNLFKRRKSNIKHNIRKYSTTLESAQDGVNSKREINKEIREIIKRLKSSDKVEHEDINKLINYYFDCSEINHGQYKLNKAISSLSTFEITDVNSVLDKNDDVTNIFLGLRETVFNLELFIVISVKDFYAFFTDYDDKDSPEEKKEETYAN